MASAITGTPFMGGVPPVGPQGPAYKEISSAENPELASQLAKEAFNETTEAPPLPETMGVLPHGYREPSGELLVDFEIRELTGASEERLSKVLSARATLNTYPQVCRTIIEEGLVNIGGIAPNEHMMKTLLIGDRDYLLMKIRIATYGADYPARIVCAKCGEQQDVVFEIGEGQDVVYKSAKSTDIQYTVDLRHGRKATIRLVNVEDQSIALRDTTLTGPERNTIIFSRCITNLNGNPLIDMQVVRAISAGDRKIIGDFLNDHRFGPMTEEVMATCSYCKAESEMSLSMAALFL